MDRSVEIRVGLVMLVAIALLVSGLLWITEHRVRDRGYTIEVLFPNANGLASGDPVQVGGVERGRVHAVSLRATDVIVSLWLPSDTEVREDAKISIADQGLMGQKFVNVSIGSSVNVAKPGAILKGQTSPSIADAMGQLSGVLEDLGRIVDAFQGAIGDSTNREMLRRTLQNTSDLAAEMNALVRNSRPEVEATLRDASVAARELRGAVETRGSKLGATIDRADAAVARFDSVMTNLGAVSASLHRITDRIEGGEGTLGKLAADDKLYLDLRKTVKDLDALLLDMQTNPGRYVRFSIF